MVSNRLPERHHMPGSQAIDSHSSAVPPRHILVIGAGVSGLTTAVCLLKEGFRVTVVAEKFAPNITSVVAGALWEWPPAVCRHHEDPLSLARSKSWCKISYNTFARLAE